jgi:hypothetical protein
VSKLFLESKLFRFHKINSLFIYFWHVFTSLLCKLTNNMKWFYPSIIFGSYSYRWTIWKNIFTIYILTARSTLIEDQIHLILQSVHECDETTDILFSSWYYLKKMLTSLDAYMWALWMIDDREFLNTLTIAQLINKSHN